VQKTKDSSGVDDEKHRLEVEKNKKLKKECQDILEKFKKVEEDYKSSIENMQNAYKKRKQNFDTETKELGTKKQEVEIVKLQITEIQNKFKEIDEIVRVKKEQKDLFLKISSMMEKNYNEYIKHCKELGDVFLEKHYELQRYQLNSQNISRILIEAMEEIMDLEVQQQVHAQQVDELKKQCKALKNKLS
jgi:predicted Rossmann fold nucleotide-binding protein DprA/Smf involved in DNA uptake